MLMRDCVSERKQKLIDQYKNNIIVNDKVFVKQGILETTNYRPDDNIECIVKTISDDGNTIGVEYSKYKEKKLQTINKKDITKNPYEIGVNPFPKAYDKLRNINFTLESIIHDILPREGRETKYEIVEGHRVEETNWNPFVIIGGEKRYYQRPFVWTLKDKQNLIDSIYNSVECGKIIIRNRSWGEVERLVKKGVTEVAFKDIVDGKQRLNAIIEFIHDEFQDSNGNYWSDLSNKAQHKFGDCQLFSYCYLGDDVNDEEVIYQFLKTNFTGVPQSTEHIDYVKGLYKDIIMNFKY